MPEIGGKKGYSVCSSPESLSSREVSCTPRYTFLTSLSLLEKMCWKWWGMLKSCQQVPSTTLMQNSVAIINIHIFPICQAILHWNEQIQCLDQYFLCQGSHWNYS